MGISNSSQAFVIPSIVCENCHMMCGFSGFPKFRQFVAATGVAPEHATLRAASATACIARSRATAPRQPSSHIPPPPRPPLHPPAPPPPPPPPPRPRVFFCLPLVVIL